MKRFLSLFLIIALMLTSCLALISCGKDKNQADDNTPDYAKMEPAEMFKSAISYTMTQGIDTGFTMYEKVFSTLKTLSPAQVIILQFPVLLELKSPLLFQLFSFPEFHLIRYPQNTM